MDDNAVMRSQSYAVNIEHILCEIFSCERFGFGGLVNSDYVRKQPLPALFIGLAYLYPNASPNKRKQIDSFIGNHRFFEEMSIDYLLSFDTNSKSDGLTTIEIDAPNGEEALQRIIDTYCEVIQ